MRALILTGPATNEQLVIAQALKSALAARGGSSLAVGALALLGQHAPLSQTTAMEREALSTPRGFAFLSAGGAFGRGQKRKSTVYEVNAKYAENLRILLAEGEFDAVLCLHRYPAEAVSYLRKTLAFSARCCFVAADFSVVPFLEETALDHYFLAHGDLCAPYQTRGISEKKLIPVGIPLPAAWFRPEEQADARALLNLPQHIPCFFIATSDDPAAASAALLARMNGTDARVCVVIPESMPARNGSARQHSDIRQINVDPDDPLALYQNACDVLLTPPVGAASAAASISGVPLIHLPPRDNFEAQTTRFFGSRGMCLSATNYDEAATLALTLAKDMEKRQSMISSQHANCLPDAAERIVRYLHEGRL